MYISHFILSSHFRNHYQINYHVLKIYLSTSKQITKFPYQFCYYLSKTNCRINSTDHTYQVCKYWNDTIQTVHDTMNERVITVNEMKIIHILKTIVELITQGKKQISLSLSLKNLLNTLSFCLLSFVFDLQISQNKRQIPLHTFSKFSYYNHKSFLLLIQFYHFDENCIQLYGLLDY